MRPRLSFFTAAALLASLSVAAQSQARHRQFDLDSKVLSFGVVAGNAVSGGIGVGVGYEFGFRKATDWVRLGIGGSVGFLTKSSKYSKGPLVPAIVFVNGHFQFEQVPELDLYAGPVVGVNIGPGAGPAGGIQGGARYNFSGRMMGMVQASEGVDMPLITIGIAFKL